MRWRGSKRMSVRFHRTPVPFAIALKKKTDNRRDATPRSYFKAAAAERIVAGGRSRDRSTNFHGRNKSILGILCTCCE